MNIDSVVVAAIQAYEAKLLLKWLRWLRVLPCFPRLSRDYIHTDLI